FSLVLSRDAREGGLIIKPIRKGTKRKKVLLAVAAVAVVLIGVRVALPTVIQDYVNDKLDESPSYDGSVGDIDLSLIRGAYRIDDIAIIKTEGDVPVPLFAAEHVEFSILWSALLKGAVVAEAEV